MGALAFYGANEKIVIATDNGVVESTADEGSFLGLDFALAKDLKISELSRRKGGTLVLPRFVAVGSGTG